MTIDRCTVHIYIYIYYSSHTIDILQGNDMSMAQNMKNVLSIADLSVRVVETIVSSTNSAVPLTEASSSLTFARSNLKGWYGTIHIHVKIIQNTITSDIHAKKMLPVRPECLTKKKIKKNFFYGTPYIASRTYHAHKNPYITVFLPSIYILYRYIFDPEYYVPP